MKIIYLFLVCATVMANGCANVPIGKVTPPPGGCLSMEFRPNDSLCIRDNSGQIQSVITPINRKEPLRKRWSLTEFESVVPNAKERNLDLPFPPGPKAWTYVKKHIKTGDEIWTFGTLDFGFVIIRNNKLFCIVVTEHQM